MMFVRAHVACAGAFTAAMLAAPAAAQGTGQPVLGLVQGTNSLVRFTTAAPGTLDPPLAVTGLVSGDTLKAIDYRPANGLLYAIATDGSNAAVRTYTINPSGHVVGHQLQSGCRPHPRRQRPGRERAAQPGQRRAGW